eukprot:357262-Amphidinium_carterae.1
MHTGPLEMHPNSATTWKGRCQYWKATMVQSTQKWLRRWLILEMPILGMHPNSATTWKGLCESWKATMGQTTQMSLRH